LAATFVRMFVPGIKGQGVYCVTLEKEGEKKKS